jgi:hypothetical protein
MCHHFYKYYNKIILKEAIVLVFFLGFAEEYQDRGNNNPLTSFAIFDHTIVISIAFYIAFLCIMQGQ